jgi:glycosyltransferase 2 family protein
MKKKHFSLAFKIASSILILYLLFANINFSNREFLEAWEKINVNWLLLSLPVVIAVLVIKSLRWRAIIRAEGHTYSAGKAIRAYFASYSMGVVTPGRLGELLKVYNLRKDNPSLDTIPAFRTVVADRLFDMYFLIWFGLSGVIFFYKPFGNMEPWFILILTFVVLLALLAAGNTLLKFTTRRFFHNNKALTFIQTCFGKMLAADSLGAWLITAFAYTIYFSGIRFLFFALSISIPFLETGFIISLIGLILLLPISVAGFGTREAGVVYLLSLYGISPETAISFSFLQFLTFFVWGGFAGLIFWAISPVPLNIIRADSVRIREMIRSRRGREKGDGRSTGR